MDKQKKLRKLIEAIAVQPLGDETTIKPTVFERDGSLFVSAEDGGFFADYYGEFRGGDLWIDPRLEAAAKECGMFWEWENPGCIVACHL